MSDLYELIEDSISSVKAQWADAAIDGVIDLSEKFDLVKLTGGAIIGAVAHVAGHGTVELQRECILEAVQDLADAIAKFDIKKIPNWIEPLVDRWITGNAVDIVDDLLNYVPGLKLP